MQSLTIFRDPYSLDEFETFEFEGNIVDQLTKHFEQWPESARIYHRYVSETTDVTPHDKESIEMLSEMEGEFYIVVYPKGPLAIIIAIVVVLSVVLALVLRPKIPNAALRNTSPTSPNNELSARTNSPRVNGRISDIFGTVRCTPDLISLPFSYYVDNSEIELCLMCIGRGDYSIDDVRDGDTPFATITGASLEIYRPFEDIVSGTPYYSVGSDITAAPYYLNKSNGVNGQTLKPSNAVSYTGDSDVEFFSTGLIQKTGGPPFTDFFQVGQNVIIQNASVPWPNFEAVIFIAPQGSSSFVFGDDYTVVNDMWASLTEIEFKAGSTFDRQSPANTVDLTGNYLVSSVTIASGVILMPDGTSHTTMKVDLSNANTGDWVGIPPNVYEAKNTNVALKFVGTWYTLDGSYEVTFVGADSLIVTGLNSEWAEIPLGGSGEISPVIYSESSNIVGPFFFDDPGNTTIIVNIVASNGLYKDDGSRQYSTSVTYEISVQKLDASGTPVGAPLVTTDTLQGSATERDFIGKTKFFNVGVGRCRVTFRRITPKDTAFKGQVIDEIKIKDLYHARPIDVTTFGNATILKCVTKGTTAALSVKERKLNMLVTREIPNRMPDGSFTGNLPTNNAADILTFVTIDEQIGGRSVDEIDLDNIYNTVDEVASYFGTTDASEFCYTFDKVEMTFEDTFASIAQSIFCTGYRYASLFRLDFEKQTEDSSLLFNHRNKIPGSEKRSVQFGYEKNYDGVELTWVNPEDDSIETMVLPSSGAVRKPKKIETVGVRNLKQAHFHAWRQWNKIQHQNTYVEMETIAQGELSIAGDRILIADGTRNDEQEGDIIEQAGLVLTTSQKVVFEPGEDYVVMLQMYDGTVQTLPAAEVPGQAYSLAISAPPALPLVMDEDDFSRTKYWLIKETDIRPKAFLVTSREPGDTNTCRISAMNYDPRYYNNDFDYI